MVKRAGVPFCGDKDRVESCSRFSPSIALLGPEVTAVCMKKFSA